MLFTCAGGAQVSPQTQSVQDGHQPLHPPHPYLPTPHQEADEERVIATVQLIFSFMCIQEKLNFGEDGL